MTPRETLDSCRSLAIETAAIARLVEMAEQRIPLMPNGCKGIAITDMPRGGNDATAAAIARVVGLEQWYLRDHAELVMLVERVEDIIGGLETWERVLMRMYYIDGKTDTEVAILMQYNFRQTAQNKRAEIVDRLCIGD
jgi:hypothetical protein